MSLDPLYTAVSWVLLRWHSLFTLIGLDAKGGLNWALSIVFLVVTARVLLFRFFIKQVHSQRRMQEMQPKIKKLQEKHKGDKATLQREMMALQQAEGFNPISGCLPMFLQLPIFISLFHVLKHMSAAVSKGYPEKKLTLYGFSRTQTLDAARAKLFNAPLAASLRESASKVTTQLTGDITATRIVIILLVIVSAAATLITQRAVIANATTPAEGQAATIQRLMMFGIPASVVFSGLIFPLGVLLYWFTSNLWTMGQQFYIFRYHPHQPGRLGASATQDVLVSPRSAAPKPGARPANKNGRARVNGSPSQDSKTSLQKPPSSQPVNRETAKTTPASGTKTHDVSPAAKAAAGAAKAGEPSVARKRTRLRATQPANPPGNTSGSARSTFGADATSEPSAAVSPTVTSSTAGPKPDPRTARPGSPTARRAPSKKRR